jgi:hypothetical protein
MKNYEIWMASNGFMFIPISNKAVGSRVERGTDTDAYTAR